MKICYRIVAVIAAAVLLLASCSSSQVKGNGKFVTKARKVRQFDELEIRGAYRVKIIQGKQNSLKITTDSNIEPLVITEIKADTLKIQNKEGVRFSTKRPILIRLVVQQLKRISASGNNQLKLSRFKGKELMVNTNGAIRATLSGKVDKLSVDISGSGKVNASKLVSNSVKVRLTGSGQVMVNATNKLDSKITGSGSIFYLGNPKNVDESIVGSGKLERMR